ncbi:MAG: periplasmic heavy metal sensor [Deltaproteobacteria bacterium]|jgi:Spy/CpxP family protein refolding chaperone|nr:periplasmic heavy metal sensor [Deltaproteobacteria bacterium]
MSILRKAPLFLLSALIVAMGGLALAQGDQGQAPPDDQGRPYGVRGGRHHDGPWAPSDGRREIWDRLQADHYDKIRPILDQIQDNRLLYGALANNRDASLDEVRKTIAELARLRKELRDQEEAFGKSLREQGLPDFVHRGPGLRMGPGYGPGSCGWHVREGGWDGDGGYDYGHKGRRRGHGGWDGDDGYDYGHKGRRRGNGGW